MTRKSGKHCVWRRETLDSCSGLIRFHHECIPWSPSLEFEPATPECRTQTEPLSHWSTLHTSAAKLTSHDKGVCDVDQVLSSWLSALHSVVAGLISCRGDHGIWMAFTCCYPLSWLSVWLRSEVVDPCFIHYHISMQKLLCVALKQLQTMLWFVDALLFLINCELSQLSHWQIFRQNSEYTAFWYLQLLCYLTQLQFTVGQNEFVEFLVFSEFGRSERSALFASVRPRLKSAYHLLTIVSNTAESE